MNIKQILYSVIFAVVAIGAAVLSYFYLFLFSVEQPTATEVGRLEPGIEPHFFERRGEQVKIGRPFYLEHASENYTKYNSEATNTLLNGMKTDGISGIDATAALETHLFEVYNNEQADPQERAYALNTINLVFNHGYNAQAFERAVAASQEFKEKFDEHKKYAFSFKPRKKPEIKGVMFDSETPGMTYAAQKTIADMNQRAFDLYPNTYSLLRHNLNSLQAEAVLHSNFETGKDYKLYRWDHLLLGLFGQDYLNDLELKLEPFLSDKEKFYEGAYSASYEVNVMYSTGVLWPQYQQVKDSPALAQEQKHRLEQVVDQANEMIHAADEFNTGAVTYAYAIASFLKSRVASENILAASENEKLYQEAVSTFERLIFQSGNNKEFRYWMKMIPENGWMGKQRAELAKRSAKINSFVTGIK